MPLVIDASATAPFIVSDEDMALRRPLEAAFSREAPLVPWIWWFEVRNLLVVNERRKRLNPLDTPIALEALRRLRPTIDASPDEAALIDLARRHGLTVYDAAYLELAMRSRATLATQDARLARAAVAESIALLAS